MKKMSKWLAILLTLCLCLSLCACDTNVDRDDDDDDDDYDYDYGITTPGVSSVTGPNDTQTQSTGNTTQNGNNIYVPALPVVQHTVPALYQSTTTMQAATFKTFTGSISQRNEADKFTYTPPRDGAYRFELVDIVSGLSFTLSVYNSLGESVQRQSNVGNNGGVVVLDMKGGQQYTIELKQYIDYGNYTLRVGEQTPTKDVTAHSVIKDSIAFRNQRNYYTFTAARDGRYLLSFADVQSDVSFYLYVYNTLGETVGRQSNMGNNDGLSVDLKGGAQYTIEVQQYLEIGDYQLNIGKQKETVDITQYTDISDSIEFKNQRNYYTFVPQRDGAYRLELNNVISSTSMYLYVYNKLGEVVERQSNVGNNDGFVVEDFKAGEIYTIMVEQYVGVGSYTLKIGKQKETVSVRAGSVVNDSVEYKGQQNRYSFVASAGQHKLSVSGLPGGTTVSIYVYNRLGERVSYKSSVSNGGTLDVRDLTVGDTYEIQVHNYIGTGSYVLKIS